jgi:hypothetical protein
VIDMSMTRRQLLAYKFPPGSAFQGQLVGALERIESGGAMRIIDGVFVGRDETSGEMFAVTMTADTYSGMTGRLLNWRLDPSSRVGTTAHALEGPAGPFVKSLADGLEPGEAVAAVLVEHIWEQTLGDAIERIGGSEHDNKFVEAESIGDAWNVEHA